MKKESAKEIIACLPKGRTLFHYYKDYYAVYLLKTMLDLPMSVREIKQTLYAKLLDRPVVKELIAQLGGQPLTREHLDNCWSKEVEPFRLTLGTYGEHDRDWWTEAQLTRPGENLVLQLNFANTHNARYKRVLGSDTKEAFLDDYHPVAEDGSWTLSWVRIDVSFEHGEALIEEVQNDWLRNVKWLKSYVERRGRSSDEVERRLINAWGLRCGKYPLDVYESEVLKPYMRMWDEATLSAAIWFIREELGVKRIFYHTWRTGNYLKNFGWTKPPRSLYSDLPRKFCFRQTALAPDYLLNCDNKLIRKRVREDRVRFYYLEK